MKSRFFLLVCVLEIKNVKKLATIVIGKHNGALSCHEVIVLRVGRFSVQKLRNKCLKLSFKIVLGGVAADATFVEHKSFEFDTIYQNNDVTSRHKVLVQRFRRLFVQKLRKKC